MYFLKSKSDEDENIDVKADNTSTDEDIVQLFIAVLYGVFKC